MPGKNKIKTIRLTTFTAIAGCLLSGIVCYSCDSRKTVSGKPDVQARAMSGFPDEEAGIANGVSACYAGVCKGKLLIAGGCNFPDVPAVEGGQKRFYQGIYLAEFASDSLFHWEKVGKLPAPAAYGVSITVPDGVVCIGGMNASGSFPTVFRLSLAADGVLRTDSLPPLPCRMDNMGGCVAGNRLFVAGGNVNGKPSNAAYSLDLNNLPAGWVALPPFPGNERVQPVCVGVDSTFYLWGGFSPAFDGKHASVSTDGYCFSPATKEWVSLPSPVDAEGNPVCLGGGVGSALNNDWLFCTGGVNETVFLSALQREEALKEALHANDSVEADSLKAKGREYMLQPAAYYRFNSHVWLYDILNKTWTEGGSFPEMARAGAALAGNGKVFYLINGELKPGIRTPGITKITIQK